MYIRYLYGWCVTFKQTNDFIFKLQTDIKIDIWL